MIGILLSILAGLLVGLQGVFNTRLSEKIGAWPANVLIHATGLLVAVVFLTMIGDGNFRNIGKVNKIYLLGGAFGVIIVFSVMKAISTLGATLSVAILLVAQLITAVCIDTFGWFGMPAVKMDVTKPLGVVIMILGIIVFKIRG